MTDLLVVGLDLVTGYEVDVAERTIPQWRKKGHNGDGSLVCAECYAGGDRLDGPRLVPLVPKGRIGGRRQPHFAHPSGLAPAGGQHSPETMWHAKAKQCIRQWAARAGATARVEAFTQDRRRRSDVAITLASGRRVAVEVQYGKITDAEWLDRHDDYVCLGIADVWLWHPAIGVPPVMYSYHQPGWLLDLRSRQLGLACGLSHDWDDRAAEPEPRYRAAHWPACAGDQIDVRWIPLANVKLTDEGIHPGGTFLAMLKQQAIRVTPPATSSRPAPPDRHPRAWALELLLSAGTPERKRRSPSGRHLDRHVALRIDALPPDAEPDRRFYRCESGCGDLTGQQLRACPIMHEIPDPIGLG